MSRYEATFEIDSKVDAHAARLLAERMYDTLREELRGTEADETAVGETLERLETIRDATRRSSAGTLTVVYETADD